LALITSSSLLSPGLARKPPPPAYPPLHQHTFYRPVRDSISGQITFPEMQSQPMLPCCTVQYGYGTVRQLSTWTHYVVLKPSRFHLVGRPSSSSSSPPVFPPGTASRTCKYCITVPPPLVTHLRSPVPRPVQEDNPTILPYRTYTYPTPTREG
jgi:hypothetical protein